MIHTITERRREAIQRIHHGIARIREFRSMVESLHLIGLRVVMDVVYNHTATAGQDLFSVLDKIVPGYYYRLDRNGDCLYQHLLSRIPLPSIACFSS